MRRLLPTVTAIVVGLVILLSYFFDGVLLLSLRLLLVDWAVTLAGLAVLVGLFNVLLVNGRRFVSSQKGWIYNFVTLLAAVLTLLLGGIEGIGLGQASLYQAGGVASLLFESVITPSMAALTGLIAFALVLAAVRLVQNKPDRWSILFLAALLIALLGWLPFSFLGVLNEASVWVQNVPVAAGARGILFGVALGTAVMGLRVITGIERPYSK